MEYELLNPLVGFTIGMVVGCLGIGGGALMMPYLLYGLHLEPIVAVGTDLMVAAGIKALGAYEHARLGTVDWARVGWLALGSVPGIALASALLLGMGDSDREAMNAWIVRAVGLALLLVASLSFFRPLLGRLHGQLGLGRVSASGRCAGLSVTGFAVGALVALTSVGSGTLVGLVLITATPLSAHRIVGTDLAHALIVIVVGALFHLGAQTIQWPVVISLLSGGLPGVWLGSRLSMGISESAVRVGISLVLVMTGAGLV